jgi:hypothetical protein
MKTKIIDVAGKTWRVLGEKKEVELYRLPDIVKEKEEVVFQALGWLAREDKIAYLSRHGEDYVALVPKEREVFSRLHGAQLSEQSSCCLKANLRKLFDLKVF